MMGTCATWLVERGHSAQSADVPEPKAAWPKSSVTKFLNIRRRFNESFWDLQACGF